jgi:hypothetical protein
VEECGRAKEATDDNTKQRMRFACWMTKVTHTHAHTASEHLIFFFYNSNGYGNAPHCYVTLTFFMPLSKFPRLQVFEKWVIICYVFIFMMMHNCVRRLNKINNLHFMSLNILSLFFLLIATNSFCHSLPSKM